MARQLLLSRLLERYENSQSFGLAAGWKRDVLLRLDEKTLPDQWAAGHAEDMDALLEAAVTLEVEGVVRLDRQKRSQVPAMLRVGEREIAALLEAVETAGVRTLQHSLGLLAEHAARQAEDLTVPPAVREFCEQVAHDARASRTDLLVADRRSFHRSTYAWLDALSAAMKIAGGLSGYQRVVSQRIFRDSKRLATIEGRVLHVLRTAVGPADAASLEEFGVQRTPRYLAIAATVEVMIGEARHRLADHEPHAWVPESWADGMRKAVLTAGVRQITTIENYTPYLAYVEDMGGAAGLARRSEAVIYTAGALPLFWLREMAAWAAANPAVQFRHWPDADAGGLRIWWSIRQHLGRPVEIFKVDIAALEEDAKRGGRALDAESVSALESIERELIDKAGLPDIANALALVREIRRVGARVEQEAWVPTR